MLTYAASAKSQGLASTSAVCDQASEAKPIPDTDRSRAPSIWTQPCSQQPRPAASIDFFLNYIMVALGPGFKLDHICWRDGVSKINRVFSWA